MKAEEFLSLINYKNKEETTLEEKKFFDNSNSFLMFLNMLEESNKKEKEMKLIEEFEMMERIP